jgi:hypothetical protein
MPSDRSIIYLSGCVACLVGVGIVFTALSLLAPPDMPAGSPAVTKPAYDRPLNYGRESDGFPLETTKGQALVNACARVNHVNPFGTITAKQATDVVTCVDLIRSGRVSID